MKPCFPTKNTIFMITVATMKPHEVSIDVKIKLSNKRSYCYGVCIVSDLS